jgi:zinc transport system permease protein
MFDILGYTFFQNALLAGICASILCGIVGTIIVIKQISSISGGIAHASFGGIGLGYYLGTDPLLTAACFSLVLTGIIAGLLRIAKERIDTLIAAIWAGGMALGILFIAATPGYTPDLFSYLFGNILMVSREQIMLMALLTAGIAATVALCYQELVSVLIDDEFSEVLGISVSLYVCLFLVLISLTVVMLITIVGIILVITLLTLPAAAVQWHCKNLYSMMIAASCVGLLCTFLGILCSYLFDIPSGATIILICIGWYGASHSIYHLRQRNKGKIKKSAEF